MPFSWTDTNAANSSARFYSVWLEPSAVSRAPNKIAGVEWRFAYDSKHLMSPSHLHKNALRLRTGEPCMLAASAWWLSTAFGQAMDFSATASGFTNLVRSYGQLETIAGCAVNCWQSSCEGVAATKAAWSHPHFAMAGRRGHPGIADQDSHSVLRVDTSGLLHTHADNVVGGFNGNGPAIAINLPRNRPGELWLSGDGTVSVLDSSNACLPHVTMSGNGTINTRNRTASADICFCESNYGFVRRIRYQRMISDH